MPSQSFTIWTCNRCSTTVTLDGYMSKPKNWSSWYYTPIPNAALSEATYVGDLCDHCTRLTDKFISGLEGNQELPAENP